MLPVPTCARRVRLQLPPNEGGARSGARAGRLPGRVFEVDRGGRQGLFPGAYKPAERLEQVFQAVGSAGGQIVQC